VFSAPEISKQALYTAGKTLAALFR